MSTTTQSPKPKRRWYQFSLKTLLIVLTVATVAFGGWVQYRRLRARENRDRMAAVEETVAAIEEVDGHVNFEYKKLRPQTWLERQFDDPGSPDDAVGVLKVKHVTFVPRRNTNSITDVNVEHLKVLKSLESLNLWGPNVTDAGLEHLNGLTNLQHLDLYNTKVTDAGLEHLKELSNLQSLDLAGADITDAGLEHLKGLTSLQLLSLPATKVTDAGLVHLKGLTSLQWLDLRGTEVTDSGLVLSRG